jgi:hypothetical protein
MGSGSRGGSSGCLGEDRIWFLCICMILPTLAVVLTTLFVKRLSVVDGQVEQEAQGRIERLREPQDVLPIFGRPLVRCDVWGRLRLYDGHAAGLFSSSFAAGVGSVAHNLRRGLGVTTRGRDVRDTHAVAGLG